LKKKTVLFSAIAIMLVLIPSAGWAQQEQTGKKKSSMPGATGDMAKMMQSPHHKLMTAHMNSMSAFATTLRDQAMKGNTVDVEVARATVAELRHNLDAMEALHQKHMQSMSTEMQADMKTMREHMDKDRAMLKDQVSMLETDVQADKPDSAQVTAHANALLKHVEMMSKMHAGSKAPKKNMDMKMDMKKPR
jgi:hypothetical protein